MDSIEQAVREGVICKAAYDSHFDNGGEFNIFTCDDGENEKTEALIPLEVLGKLQKAIHKLGDDTPLLLDYVYFNTEPMADVKKGDLLDFSKAQKRGPVKRAKIKALSPDVIASARQKIKQLSEDMNAHRERLARDDRETSKYKDDIYNQFIKKLDGEELTVGLKGTAKIQMAE